MRMACSVEPGPIVEARGLDHECVAIPVADRVSQPRWVRIFRQLPSIHVDLPVTTGSILEEHGHDRGGVDDSIRRVDRFRRTAWQAVCNGIILPEIFDALHENGFRRRPEDGFILQILYDVE